MWKLRKSDSRQFPETILDKLPSFYDYFFPSSQVFLLKDITPFTDPSEVKTLPLLLDSSHLASQVWVFSFMNRKQKDSTLRRARWAEGSVSFISSALHRPRERPIEAYHIPTASLPGVDLSELIHTAESWGWPWTPDRPACTSQVLGLQVYTTIPIMLSWGSSTELCEVGKHSVNWVISTTSKTSFGTFFQYSGQGDGEGRCLGNHTQTQDFLSPLFLSLPLLDVPHVPVPQDTWLAVVKAPQVFTTGKTLTWPIVQLGPV